MLCFPFLWQFAWAVDEHENSASASCRNSKLDRQKKKKEKSNVLFRHMQRLCVQGFQTGQMVERVNLRPTTKNTSSTFSFFIRHRGGGGQAARDTWFWYFPLVSLSTVLSLTLSQSKTKALHWQPQYSALQKVRNFYFSAVWTATRTLMLG